MSLLLRGEIEINRVAWEITRVGMEPMNGTINTSAPGSTPSVEIFGLEPESGYLITMTATSALAETSCKGSADFSVESGLSTNVMVLLNCEPPRVLGGVRVDGELNVCADLKLVTVVAPLETSVGSNIQLSAEAADEEGDEIAYKWETSNGSLSDPNAANTVYTCQELGNHDVMVAVSDDGFQDCEAGWTVRVTCVEGGGPECESDEDCRAFETCTENVCVPDADCFFNSDCDAGEICVDLVCVPDVECNFDEDCGEFEICVKNVCERGVECHFNLDCESGEICIDHECIPDIECTVDADCDPDEVCVLSECIPDVECEVDQDCDPGEVCFRNFCVPDLECNFDRDCEDGEICVDNVCVPDIQCTSDQECEDFNECTVTSCNLATSVCSSENLQDGTPCDGGDGVCVVGQCRTNDLFGTDFVVVFEANYLAPQLTLFLSGPQPTAGVISIPATGFSEGFFVAPDSVTKVVIPTSAQVASSDVVETGAAIQVSSTNPITVYGFNRVLRGTDAFAALPTVALGERYRVMAWSGGVNGTSQFAIAGTPDFAGDTTTTTTVTITPAAAAGNRPAGVPYTVELKPFDAYQLRSSGDLTGSLIQADRPVAVFGGNSCANIPTQETGFCDHVVEQLTPVDTWGNEALTVPLATRTQGDTFRIVADRNGTRVQLQGASPESFTLNAGEFAERNLTGSYRISADAPILVSQFSNGSQWDNSTSDPFMMLIPSADRFIKSYTFATPSTGFPINYANIVAMSADLLVGAVRLDGTPLDPSLFTQLPGTAFSAAQVPISVGTHTLTSANPVGLYVYGYESFDSYGYPGGFSADDE